MGPAADVKRLHQIVTETTFFFQLVTDRAERPETLFRSVTIRTLMQAGRSEPSFVAEEAAFFF